MPNETASPLAAHHHVELNNCLEFVRHLERAEVHTQHHHDDDHDDEVPDDGWFLVHLLWTFPAHVKRSD